MSDVLAEIAASLPPDRITVRELLHRVGKQGMLMTCMFLAMPFVVPVSIPGVSIGFGLLIGLLAIGLALNRMPWLPGRLLNRAVRCDRLARVLDRGGRFFRRIERVARPRLIPLTAGSVMNVVSCAVLLFGGLLMAMPLGLVPLTNTLPALGVLFLSFGILERDGLLVLVGYGLTLATVVYFAALAGGAWAAASSIRTAIFGASMIF